MRIVVLLLGSIPLLAFVFGLLAGGLLRVPPRAFTALRVLESWLLRIPGFREVRRRARRWCLQEPFRLGRRLAAWARPAPEAPRRNPMQEVNRRSFTDPETKKRASIVYMRDADAALDRVVLQMPRIDAPDDAEVEDRYDVFTVATVTTKALDPQGVVAFLKTLEEAIKRGIAQERRVAKEMSRFADEEAVFVDRDREELRSLRAKQKAGTLDRDEHDNLMRLEVLAAAFDKKLSREKARTESAPTSLEGDRT